MYSFFSQSTLRNGTRKKLVALHFALAHEETDILSALCNLSTSSVDKAAKYIKAEQGVPRPDLVILVQYCRESENAVGN
jgi:hypothetical protein